MLSQATESAESKVSTPSKRTCKSSKIASENKLESKMTGALSCPSRKSLAGSHTKCVGQPPSSTFKEPGTTPASGSAKSKCPASNPGLVSNAANKRSPPGIYSSTQSCSAESTLAGPRQVRKVAFHYRGGPGGGDLEFRYHNHHEHVIYRH